jgi:acetolactate synthase regulatory subunit
MPAPTPVRRRLELATTGQPDTLLRVLHWLRRHGCTLTRVEYVTQDRHGPGRFLVTVHVPVRHDDRLERGLENLVGVVSANVE